MASIPLYKLEEHTHDLSCLTIDYKWGPDDRRLRMLTAIIGRMWKTIQEAKDREEKENDLQRLR